MTSTDSDLLRAILRDPADDTPRLALADWLEENAGEVDCARCERIWSPEKIREFTKPVSHGYQLTGKDFCKDCHGSGRVSDGRAVRAEFIRVQVELARMPDKLEHYHWRGKDKCRRCKRDELRRRERAFFERHRHAWFHSSPGYWAVTEPRQAEGVGGVGLIVSRGFVSELRCTLAAFVADDYALARAVFAREPVTAVVLSDREPDHAWWWWRDNGSGYYSANPAYLPPPLYRLAKAENGEPDRAGCLYPTRAAALSALSRAAVNRGRSLVGQGALPAEAAGVRV